MVRTEGRWTGYESEVRPKVLRTRTSGPKRISEDIRTVPQSLKRHCVGHRFGVMDEKQKRRTSKGGDGDNSPEMALPQSKREAIHPQTPVAYISVYVKTRERRACSCVALRTLLQSTHHRPPSALPATQTLIMVLLVTSDNEQFVVDKEVAERSVLIKNMLEGAHATLRS